MILTTLGGSAAGGNPGVGCSGYLLQTETTSLVIDLGTATLQELRLHCDFRTLDAVVISHWHVDHILDLAALRFAVAYNPRPPTRRIALYLPPGTAKHLREFGSSLVYGEEGEDFFDAHFDVDEYDPDRTLDIGDVTCLFHEVRHFVPCWGLRVVGPDGSSLGYTADTGPGVGLESFFAAASTVIAEAAFVEYAPGDTSPGHLTAEDAGRLATDAGARTLVLTHIWEEHGYAAQRDRAAKTFDGEILIAKPGLALQIAK
jgi:ribonuclease BN (tRNA processing enzyme)